MTQTLKSSHTAVVMLTQVCLRPKQNTFVDTVVMHTQVDLVRSTAWTFIIFCCMRSMLSLSVYHGYADNEVTWLRLTMK